MLKLLADYARTHDVEVEAGFKSKDVRWAIRLSSAAGFTGLVELGQPDQNKNPGRTFKKCPDLSQMEMVSGEDTKCHFLVETADVVALYGEKAGEARVQAKHQYFIKLLADAAQTMPRLAIIADLLRSADSLKSIQRAMGEMKLKSTEKVTFQLDEEFLVDQNDWRDWWRQYRQSLKIATGDANDMTLMRCFITGELMLPVATHFKIERLADVGGQPSGDVLIGFDKDAFRSYGLDQSANAAVCENAMSAYRAGLNELIKNHSQRLVGAKVVHWFKQKIAREEDPLYWLTEPPGQAERNAQYEAKKLFESVRTGNRPDLAENHYYAMMLSGAGGRVMVRDWMEGQFTELVEGISKWFDDLEIVQRDGNQSTRSPKFLAVLSTLIRDLNNLPAPIVTKMWRVALHGEIIPYSFLAQVLTRRRTEIIKNELINTTGMGLIKAYHLRKYRKEGNSTLTEMLKPNINEDFPGPAYQCGRLMAVYADLQRSALGDVGAGVIQRYYAAASATPALVLGRIARTSQFHLNKLDRGLAYWYETKIADIWGRIQDSIPRTLSLEEQSLFALGYYQQLAAMRSKKSQNNNCTEKEEING